MRILVTGTIGGVRTGLMPQPWVGELLTHPSRFDAGSLDVPDRPGLLLNRPASSSVRQGVTTEVVGNCGSTFVPAAGESIRGPMPHCTRSIPVDWRTFGEYLDRLAQPGLGENVAHLLGIGSCLR